jgi:hypothetical protein
VATNPKLSEARALGWLLYLVAFLLIVGPISEWLLISWPLQPDQERWRFATIGLLGDRLSLPIVGLFIAIVSATLRQHRVTQTILAGLSILAAPTLIVLAFGMALDGIQLRTTVRADVLWGYDRSLARTVILLFYGAFVTGVLGRVALKARTKRSSRSKTQPLPLRAAPEPTTT